MPCDDFSSDLDMVIDSAVNLCDDTESWTQVMCPAPVDHLLLRHHESAAFVTAKSCGVEAPALVADNPENPAGFVGSVAPLGLTPGSPSLFRMQNEETESAAVTISQRYRSDEEEGDNRTAGDATSGEISPMETDATVESPPNHHIPPAAASSIHETSTSSPSHQHQQQHQRHLAVDVDNSCFLPPPRRISMLWNSKLRLREERKRVLKMSVAKLRRIDDPEQLLRRSVLINNTVRRLHRDIRDEKTSSAAAAAAAAATADAFCRKRPPPDSVDHFPRAPVASPPRPSTSSASSASYGLDYHYDVAASTYNGDKENRSATYTGGSDYWRLGGGGSGGTSGSHHLDDGPPAAKRVRCGATGNERSPLVSVKMADSTDEEEELQRRLQHPTTSDTTPIHQLPFFRNVVSPSDHPSTSSSAAITRTCSALDEALTEEGLLVDGASRLDLTTSAPSCSDEQAAAAARKLQSAVISSTTPPPGGRDRNVGGGASAASVADHQSEYEKQYTCGQLSIFGDLQSVVFHSLITSLEWFNFSNNY